ncbi:STAS domain-containing protein [Streptomyces sp. NPDC052000]|uniref:STAS domain-containing protein n=1 Tax=Streptomyces sp. NPDC052000 TaxID=3155676 RepID=UPI00344F1DA1
MTIQWRYTTHDNLGVLSVAGHLGGEAVDRFTGAIGWVMARGTGPVVLDLTDLRGWSAGGQLAIAQAARLLAVQGRALELAAIPANGSIVPDGTHPPVPVHHDLPAALTAHQVSEEQRQWRTTDWPDQANPAQQSR